jgi:hypothetical protein
MRFGKLLNPVATSSGWAARLGLRIEKTVVNDG